MRPSSALLALCLLGSACSGPDNAGSDSALSEAQPLNTSVRVRVVAAEESEIGKQATVSGVVEPFRSAVVAAEVGGRVLERLVEPGDRVVAGASLIRLDDERVRIARNEAIARRRTQAVNLAEARNELQRGEDLREQQFISDTELDGLRFAVQRAGPGCSRQKRLWLPQSVPCRTVSSGHLSAARQNSSMCRRVTF